MPPDGPLVTVILTCFEHEAFLPQALAGVAAQTYPWIELIATDDASTDGSADILASWLEEHRPEATFIRHDVNTGLCRILNEALEHATGRYVTITSADDWMEPQRVERQVAAFESAGEGVGLVYSGVRWVSADGTELGLVHTEPGALPSGRVYHRMLEMPIIPTPTVMVRRSVFDDVGGFNEDDIVEDYDMWLRITRDHEVLHVPEALVNYRWHDANVTGTIQDGPYEAYVATCLRRQLGVSAEVDAIVERRLAALARRSDRPSDP